MRTSLTLYIVGVDVIYLCRQDICYLIQKVLCVPFLWVSVFMFCDLDFCWTISQAARGCWITSGEAKDVEPCSFRWQAQIIAPACSWTYFSPPTGATLKNIKGKKGDIVRLCTEFARRCHSWDWDLNEDKFSFCPDERLLGISFAPYNDS